MYGLKKEIDLSFLVGRELEQVAVGLYQVQFHFDKSVSIGVSSRFTVWDSADRVTEWSPQNPRLAAPTFDCLHHSINSVITEENGTLTLGFSNGAHIVIFDNDPAYESYTITAPGLTIVV